MDDAFTLDWLLTLLMFHVVLLAGVIGLFKGAPCWLQKLAVVFLIASAVVFCLAYMAALFGVARWYYILLIAFVLEHLGVVVYVFRVYWKPAHGNADRAAPQVR